MGRIFRPENFVFGQVRNKDTVVLVVVMTKVMVVLVVIMVLVVRLRKF